MFQIAWKWARGDPDGINTLVRNMCSPLSILTPDTLP